MSDIRDSILSAIGDTPVVRLSKLVDDGSAAVDTGLKYLAGDLFEG